MRTQHGQAGGLPLPRPIVAHYPLSIPRKHQPRLLQVPFAAISIVPGPAVLYIPILIKYFPSFVPSVYATAAQHALMLAHQTEARLRGGRSLFAGIVSGDPLSAFAGRVAAARTARPDGSIAGAIFRIMVRVCLVGLRWDLDGQPPLFVGCL